jgi:lysyl endopeptidase
LSVSGSLPLLSIEFSGLGVVSHRAGAPERGLAGDVPEGSWLPRLPNGTPIGPMPASLHDRYVTLNQKFGNAWRVTKSNSLFDYASGTSTATFTNAAWPVENAKTCTVPNVKTAPHISAEAAEEACRSITNKTLHSSCVFDVQLTGLTHLARTYEVTERIHAKLVVKPITIRPIRDELK